MEEGPKVRGWAPGCGAATQAAFLGSGLTFGIVYVCSAVYGTPIAGDAMVVAFWMTLLLLLLGAVASSNYVAATVRKPTTTTSPLPPNVEEAARARFTPSTSPKIQEVNPEERIRQPGNHGAQEAESQSDTE
jgi:hypothetical protein